MCFSKKTVVVQQPAAEATQNTQLPVTPATTPAPTLQAMQSAATTSVNAGGGASLTPVAATSNPLASASGTGTSRPRSATAVLGASGIPDAKNLSKAPFNPAMFSKLGG